MYRRGDVFSRPERAPLRKVGIHLCWSLGAWRILKHHSNAVDRELFDGPYDLDVWGDQANGPCRNGLPNRLVDMAVGACWQHGAILICHSSVHGIPGHDVFRDRM